MKIHCVLPAFLTRIGLIQIRSCGEQHKNIKITTKAFSRIVYGGSPYMYMFYHKEHRSSGGRVSVSSDLGVNFESDPLRGV